MLDQEAVHSWFADTFDKRFQIWEGALLVAFDEVGNPTDQIFFRFFVLHWPLATMERVLKLDTNFNATVLFNCFPKMNKLLLHLI